MAKGFSTFYRRPVGPFKVSHKALLKEASEMMIEDAIKNIKDEKTPGRRPQKRNMRATLERKRKKGYGSKSLIERRKSLTRRSGWAMTIDVNSRGGNVGLRPNSRFLSDEAVEGLLGFGYDFVGISRTALRVIGSHVAKRTVKMLESRRVKSTTLK